MECVYPVIPGQCKLGLHRCRWGTQTEEWWFAPLQDHDGVQVQPQAAYHRNTAAELSKGAVVPSALHHAWQVGVDSHCPACVSKSCFSVQTSSINRWNRYEEWFQLILKTNIQFKTLNNNIQYARIKRVFWFVTNQTLNWIKTTPNGNCV